MNIDNEILIVGGNGVIGTELTRKLYELGCKRLTVFDEILPRVFLDGIRYISKPISDLDKIYLPDYPEIVINLAGVSRVNRGQENPLMAIEYNTLGCVKVLDLARKWKSKLNIYASSREVYGEPAEFPVTEQTIKRPINHYGVSKFAAEMFCESFAKTENMNIIVVRPSNVYGSKYDHHTRVIPNFIRRALINLPLIINGGKQKFDFCYIDDTVNHFIKLLENTPNGFDDFNIVPNDPHSIEELVQFVLKLTNSKSNIKYLDRREYDVDQFWGDYIKSKTKLRWEPKVKLEDGLKKTIELFR